jgi:hypothetical protein
MLTALAELAEARGKMDEAEALYLRVLAKGDNASVRLQLMIVQDHRSADRNTTRAPGR